jgi:polar amino acid transport system substrate-binding protein
MEGCKDKNLTRWKAGGGLIVLLLVIVAVGLLLRAREDDGTLARVQATGELRVGLDASFPPFETLDAGGNIVGLDADLARAIATALGAEPVFVNVGFDGLYDALQIGRIDVVISGLPYDPRRTQDVNYSQPYFNAGQVLVVRPDDTTFPKRSAGIPMPAQGLPTPATGIPTPAQGTFPNRSAGIPMPAQDIPMSWLAGRTVAVEWGSLADMEARRLKETAEGMQTLPQPTARDALDALVAGKADAAIADAVSVYQFIGERDGEVRVVTTLTDEPYVMATRVKSRRLAEAIDETLAELRESGALDELMDSWF